jgi:hypothetical protein
MKIRYLMLFGLTVAACSDDAPPASTLVPGAAPEGALGSRAVQLVSENLRPCGYDHTATFPPAPGQIGNINRYRARITYDARGLAILEAAVDDNNAFVHRYENEYDTMGNLSHYVSTYPDDDESQGWLVYDSFGRLVRYEITQDYGDAVEELVATYGYGSDGNRISAHRVQSRGIDDRTYRYDGEGRLIELTQDNGPDGVIDLTSRFEYDDTQRTTTMTMTDPAGLVVETNTTHYDDDNHVVLEEHFSIRSGSMAPSYTTYTNTYAGGRLVTSAQVTRQPNPTLGDYTYDIREQWRYDGCR